MRRDMDLVRHILITVADASAPVTIESLVTGDWPRSLVLYHLRIMEEAGLIRLNLFGADGGPCYLAGIDGLTWEGNDFLDAVRSDSVWAKVKTRVAQVVGSTSFDVIKAFASEIATRMLLS